METKEFYYEKIPYLKKIKKFFSELNYKGINLWPIMATEAYTFYQNQEINFRERIVKELKYLFFMEKYEEVLKGNGKILVSYFMPRKDHHELVLKSIEKFPKKDLMMLDCFETKQKNPFLRTKFSFPNLILFFNLWNKFRRNHLKEVLGKYYFLFLTRTYVRYKEIGEFYKIYNKYKPKALITFCSQAFAEDAILTLIFRKEKKKTFNLQHGFTIEHHDFSPISILNENIISNYNLVWGKSTYNIQKKYADGSKFLIVGNPKYSLIKNKKKGKFSPKYVSIFLTVPPHEKAKEIVKIINNFALKNPKIKFEIKAHPFDEENYSEIVNAKNISFVKTEKQIKDMLLKSDAVILHNTSIAYEALLYRIPVFRFNDEVLVDLWEHNDKFKNLKELEELFNRLKSPKVFRKEIKFYEEESHKNMYFHPKKGVSQIYYEEIIKRI